MTDRPWDVVVVGGGAAGAAAALAASRKAKRVCVVFRAHGATALSSGAVDLAGDPQELSGDPWQKRRTTESLLSERFRLEPHHPLSVAAVEAPEAASILEKLCEALPLLASRPLDLPPLVLPTDLGTFKSTTLCGKWALEGDLPALDGCHLGVVRLSGYPAYDAHLLAEGYVRAARQGNVHLEATPVAVDVLRLRGEELAQPSALAASLEREPTLKRLADALHRAQQRHHLDHLILPPVMGLLRWEMVMERIRQQVSASEMLAAPPAPVPGLRLQHALYSALEQRGVTIISAKALAPSVEGDGLKALRLDQGRELPGRAFVLATGKFIGGGVEHRQRLKEPLFHLPVWVDDQGPDPLPPAKFLHRQARGPHLLMRAGIRVDRQLRPLLSGGAPAWDNLFAAGSVVGGYDYITGRSGLGTALITGYLAGAHAAQGEEA